MDRTGTKMEENSQLIINAAIKKGQLILQKADEKADAIITEAKMKAASEAERILAKAKQEAEEEALKIIVEAKNRAEKMTFIIRREAEQLVPANCKMTGSDKSNLTGIGLEHKNKFSESSEAHTAVLVKPKSVAPVPKPLNSQQKHANNATRALYHDIVEIVISPPITTKKLFGFLLCMRKVPGIKVLKFKERTDGGFTVKLRLQKAVPLADILSALPEVQKVSQPMPRGQQQNPIAVMLKN